MDSRDIKLLFPHIDNVVNDLVFDTPQTRQISGEYTKAINKASMSVECCSACENYDTLIDLIDIANDSVYDIEMLHHKCVMIEEYNKSLLSYILKIIPDSDVEKINHLIIEKKLSE